MMTSEHRLRRTAGAAFLLVLGLAGCSDDIVDTADPNRPPDTVISSDAPRPHEEHSYLVRINWNGSDDDGRIAGYFYAWDDTVTEGGVPTWQFTTASESTFVVQADSCASPPCGGETEPFFDYHTFWVKSVDDQGAHDPTPSFRTFTATTIAPETLIEIGPFAVCAGGVCDLNSDYVFVEWRGSDPDGQVSGYWYKWDARLQEFPTSAGPDPVTNGWTFLPPESTSIASRRQQLFPGCSPRANSFAIFAVDDAGAIQQVSQCGVNWTCFCPDSTRGGPGICIDGGILGRRSSADAFCDPITGEIGSSDPDKFDFETVTGAFEGTPIGFRWTRLESEKGRTPAPLLGYRYAIDDPDAFTPLSRTKVSLPDSLYARGSHTLYVEAVDRAGIVDQGKFQFIVSPGPVYRDPPIPKRILLVDDNGKAGDVYYAEWRQVQGREPANWDSLLQGFRYDTWDTQDRGGAPQVPVVEDYTTIIWNAGHPTGGQSSALFTELFQPRAEYLSSYIRAGGHVILTGMNPMFAMVIRGATTEGGDLCQQSPAVNVWMFWDPVLCGLDPAEAFPHFLFTRLGVRQMKLPTASEGYYEPGSGDRTVRGCIPVDSSGTFNRYLAVDTLRAGGDTFPFNMIPAANVTTPGNMESWSTPVYYLDSPDPAIVQNVLGIVSIGNQNPRKTDVRDWGNAAFLSINPYFLNVADAKWYFRTTLEEICHEEYIP